MQWLQNYESFKFNWTVLTGFTFFRDEFESWIRGSTAAAVGFHHFTFLSCRDITAVVVIVVLAVVMRVGQNFSINYWHLAWRSRHFVFLLNKIWLWKLILNETCHQGKLMVTLFFGEKTSNLFSVEKSFTEFVVSI